MSFKQREESELIQIKVIDEDGSFEYLKVTLEEFKELSCDFYQPKYYFKNGKGYPFPEEESEWSCLLGSFITLEC